MRLMYSLSLLLALIVFARCNGDDNTSDNHGPKAVAKTNGMKIYMHYMPWFQSKDVSGYWGSHWTMKNKNPDITDGAGKRQIASHYYPLIGPYDSKDPDVAEYHLLLMKYAGIDGVLIDWYGSHNIYDYKVNLTGTNTLVDKLDDVGMQFALVYEDYVNGSVENQTPKTALEAAKEDILYAQAEYFSKGTYITIDNAPLFMTFGPRQFKIAAQWTEIFSTLPVKPQFLPLWNHAGYVGTNGSGEYAWVDFNESLNELTSFYKKNQPKILMGSAYPRFHDFYKEGGTGESYGNVAYNNGETLRKTLKKAKDNNIQTLQLVTWNDFGEGTAIEPTLEDSFQCLQIIQEFTGVSYGQRELELVHTYYLKRKQYKGDAAATETLDKVFQCLSSLDVAEARDLLSQL